MISISDILAATPIFAALSADQRAVIAAIMRPYQRSRGELLAEQGEADDSLIVIHTGRAEIELRMPGVGRRRVGELGPHDVIGELALVDGEPRSARVRATEDLSGAVLERRDFERILDGEDPAALALLLQLSHLICTRLEAVSKSLGQKALQAVRHSCGTEPGLASLRQSTGEVPIAALNRLGYFQAFSEDQCAALLSSCSRIALPRHHLVFAPGDAAESVFVVLSGAVELAIPAAEQLHKLAVLGPGHGFGHGAWFGSTIRGNRASTREQVQLLEIPTPVFASGLAAQDSIAARLLRASAAEVAQRLRSANRRQSWALSAPQTQG